MIDYTTYVEHVRQDGQRLAVAASGSLSKEVPSCPGWTVRDLVSHVAGVYEHKIACTELGRAPEPWPPEWPSDRNPIEWFGDAHGRLLQMFEMSRPTTPSATWWPPDQTMGFWARRMAHETAVHRTDAELATGAPTPVNAQLAVDGVDEILVIMLARIGRTNRMMRPRGGASRSRRAGEPGPSRSRGSRRASPKTTEPAMPRSKVIPPPSCYGSGVVPRMNE